MGGWKYHFFEVLFPLFGPPLIGGIVGHWVGGRAIKGAISGAFGGWAGIALYVWGYLAASGTDAASLTVFSAFLVVGSALGGWLGARTSRKAIGDAAEAPVTGDPSTNTSRQPPGQHPPADRL